jgi:hypothetical protein
MVALSSASAGAAGANGAPPPAEIQAQERKTSRSFYGWEILATGEIGGLLMVASVVLPETPVGTPLATAGFIIGAPAFVLSGPVVHWSHNQFDKGLLSLAGNIALPLLGGIVSRSAGCDRDAETACRERAFLMGLGLAAAVTPVIDALVLGWEDVPWDDTQTSTASLRSRPRVMTPPRFSMAPSFGLGPRGELTLGLGGRF